MMGMRLAAVLFAAAWLLPDDATGHVSPEFHLVECAGYALDVVPPDSEVPERTCYRFDAVAGQRVEARRSGSGLIWGYAPYGMGCAVMVGPREGDAFSVQESATNGWSAVLNYTIPQAGAYIAEVMFWGRKSLFVDEQVRWSLSDPDPPPCVADAASLCLGGWRFRVSADWQVPNGYTSHAAAVGLTTDAGYFYFFDPSNVEIVVKVLDGCASNGFWWFFAAGLTDVGATLTVTDTVTGASRPYANAPGHAFAAIQDTTAFPCP